MKLAKEAEQLENKIRSSSPIYSTAHFQRAALIWALGKEYKNSRR